MTDSLRFRYISPAIASLSGYEPAELFALSLRQLLPDESWKWASIFELRDSTCT